MMTLPFEFLAARPMVCIIDVSDLRKPSLSASKMATRETSGISNPSLKRFIPTNTSNLPSLKSLIISVLSRVTISECIYFTLIPDSRRYLVKSSLIFFVRVVIKTLSPFSTFLFISTIRSSIWFSTGLTLTVGSNRPVGLIICSANTSVCSISYGPGVAVVNRTWCILDSNSSKLSGLLS